MGRGFEPHRRQCAVSSTKNINPRKTRPFITERLLVERNESNKNKQRSSEKNVKHLPVMIIVMYSV